MLELEAGYLYQRRQVNAQLTPFLFKLTLLRWLQLQLGSNGGVFIGNARDFDDLLFGVKLHLLDQSRRAPSLALTLLGSFPIFPERRDLRSYDLFATAHATKDTAWLHLDLNGGVNAWRLDAPRVQGFFALAASVELPRGLTPMVEGYYFSPAAPVAISDAGILLALAYAPRPFLVLDAGGDVGLIQSNRKFSAFVGLTVLIARLWGRPSAATLPPVGSPAR